MKPLRILIPFLLLIIQPTLGYAFEPPTAEARLEAIGDTSELEPATAIAFLKLAPFKPIPKPSSIDWLAMHEEPGQTYQQFLESKPPVPSKAEKFIYLQPIGDFEPEAIDFETLKSFCLIYFNTEVQILPSLSIDKDSVASRINSLTNKLQYKSIDIIELLNRQRPDDAFAVAAFTMTDLYPEDSWNFVFGQADYRRSLGVFSFARYGDPVKDAELFNLRALKVMAHEIGHMYGMRHCIHFHCLMNGSNGLYETDEAPLHMCPVCLRKLHFSTQFDPIERYTKLGLFYENQSMEVEAKFAKERVNAFLDHALN